MIYLAVEHLQSGAKSLLEKFTQEGGIDYIDEAIALDREASLSNIIVAASRKNDPFDDAPTQIARYSLRNEACHLPNLSERQEDILGWDSPARSFSHHRPYVIPCK